MKKLLLFTALIAGYAFADSVTYYLQDGMKETATQKQISDGRSNCKDKPMPQWMSAHSRPQYVYVNGKCVLGTAHF